MKAELRQALDWGQLVPLRLKARRVADGAYAGTHRSLRRGAGVEFGGHRNYVPGDDLRRLDRHALMRHGRLLIREFETDTDRTLRLLVDATASMGFSSARGTGTKLRYAAVVAAALARIALASGDPVSLDWLGGRGCRRLPALGGRDAFDRIVGALEDGAPSGDLHSERMLLERPLAVLAQHSRRGAILVFLSDLLDLPGEAPERLAALGSQGRTIIVVRVLDPMEAEFTLQGPVRLRSSEGRTLVETDATEARAGYLRALEGVADRLADRLLPRGGRVVRATTGDDPVDVVRAVLAAAGNRTW